jgi:hypothetical protein
MRVFFNGRLIVVESNVEWALPYWAERKRMNKRITWSLTNVIRTDSQRPMALGA